MRLFMWTSKDTSLEVTAHKSEYVNMIWNQNQWQNHHITWANKWFENVLKFKYQDTILMNRSRDQYESRRGMNFVDWLYCWCKNLPPYLLLRTLKNMVYKTFLLLVWAWNMECYFEGRMYKGYPESKIGWAIVGGGEFISKPLTLPFDVRTVHYFST
jgi:hypothetical protein